MDTQTSVIEGSCQLLFVQKNNRTTTLISQTLSSVTIGMADFVTSFSQRGFHNFYYGRTLCAILFPYTCQKLEPDKIIITSWEKVFF